MKPVAACVLIILVVCQLWSPVSSTRGGGDRMKNVKDTAKEMGSKMKDIMKEVVDEVKGSIKFLSLNVLRLSLTLIEYFATSRRKLSLFTLIT